MELRRQTAVTQTVVDARVLTYAGSMIQVAAGTYVESSSIVLNPGVSIDGAGAGQTILKKSNPAWAGFDPSGFLIQMTSSSFANNAATLSDFSIDGTAPSGETKPLLGGIVIGNRGSITVNNVAFNDIYWSALWMGYDANHPANGITVSNDTFTRCGGYQNALSEVGWWNAGDYSSAAIQPAFVQNVEIRNFSIVDSTLRTGSGTQEVNGYGIDALGSGSPRGSWSNVSIHDGTIDLYCMGGWNNGLAPNIAIEVNLVDSVQNCSIYNNTIKNNISLVHGGASTGTTTFNIHDNAMPLYTSPAGRNGQYALELDFSDVIFNHNAVTGGNWAVSGFYGLNYNNANTGPRQNITFSRNIFRGINADWSTGTFLLTNASNVLFYNNTVDWTYTGGNAGETASTPSVFNTNSTVNGLKRRARIS